MSVTKILVFAASLRTVWAAAAVLAGALGVQGPCLASEVGMTPNASGILGALAGAAVPAAELGRQHARGTMAAGADCTSISCLQTQTIFKNPNITTTTTTTTLTNTATIGSINNNTGITTVFQNSGNNSLFQQTTALNVTVH
jgi:hypothetical protein